MSYKVKLIKGRSYHGNGIKVDIQRPELNIETEEQANRLLATGYFSLISAPEQPSAPEAPKSDENDGGGEGNKPEGISMAISLSDMSVAELKAFAAENNIDITGATKKADILEKVLAAGEELQTEEVLPIDVNSEGNTDSKASGSAEGGSDGVIGSFTG